MTTGWRIRIAVLGLCLRAIHSFAGLPPPAEPLTEAATEACSPALKKATGAKVVTAHDGDYAEWQRPVPLPFAADRTGPASDRLSDLPIGIDSNNRVKAQQALDEFVYELWQGVKFDNGSEFFSPQFLSRKFKFRDREITGADVLRYYLRAYDVERGQTDHGPKKQIAPFEAISITARVRAVLSPIKGPEVDALESGVTPDKIRDVFLRFVSERLEGISSRSARGPMEEAYFVTSSGKLIRAESLLKLLDEAQGTPTGKGSAQRGFALLQKSFKSHRVASLAQLPPDKAPGEYQSLTAIMREIYATRFHSKNPDNVLAEIQNLTLVAPDGTTFNGRDLYARWHASRYRATGTNEVIDFPNRLRHAIQGNDPVPMGTTKWRGTGELDETAALKEFFEDWLKRHGNDLSAATEAFKPADFLTPDGRIVSSLTLFVRAEAHRAEELKIRSPKSRKSIDHFVLKRIIEHYAAEAIKRAKTEEASTPAEAAKPKKKLDFAKMDHDEVDEFARDNGLLATIGTFVDDPAILVEVLAFTRPRLFEGQNVVEFVKRYVGLNVPKTTETQKVDGEFTPERKRQAYLQFVLAAGEQYEQLAFRDRFARQLELFVKLSRRSFEADPEGYVARLRADAKKYTKENYKDHSETALVFLQALHERAAERFERIARFHAPDMKTESFGYQREGALFLSERKRAILADEAGLGKTYQAIAGVQAVRAENTRTRKPNKRTLWITTASNVPNVRDEILGHTKLTDSELPGKSEVLMLKSGDPVERDRQANNLGDAKYVVANYENLVAFRERDPKGYEKFIAEFDITIVDEAHLADNEDSLRSSAVRVIPSERVWLLSATPYQNKLENLWTLLNFLEPDRFPDKASFKKTYTQSAEGVLMLHEMLDSIMLRRTKDETLGHFVNPTTSGKTYRQQIAEGPKIPRINRVDPEKAGAYELSNEQAELVAWMVNDFEGFAKAWNETAPLDQQINLANINPLQKFSWIHEAIYSPEKFGIDAVNPLYAAVDRIVQDKLARGEKVILWAENTAVLNALMKRYGKDARRLDGEVTGKAREKVIADFQGDPSARILVANSKAGGVGLTLTAATAAVYVQLPSTFTGLYQSEARHHRVIGMKNEQHAKEEVETYFLIPQYSADFLASVEKRAPGLARLLASGTLVQQTHQRLNGGRLVYRLAMEGYGDPKELEEQFQKGLAEGMGLKNRAIEPFAANLPAGFTMAGELGRAFVPLWRRAKEKGFESLALDLVELSKRYPKQVMALSALLAEHPSEVEPDLRLLLSVFQIRNKHVRETLLDRLPDIMKGLYEKGSTLREAAGDAQFGRLTPVAYLGPLLVKGGNAPYAKRVAQALGDKSDSPQKLQQQERLFVGLLGMKEGPTSQWLEKHDGALAGETVEVQADVIYRAGLIASTRPDVAAALVQHKAADGKELRSIVDEGVYAALADFAGIPTHKLKEALEANPNWNRPPEQLLALLSSWKSRSGAAATRDLEGLKQTLQHLADGDFTAKRNENPAVEYLNDNPAFWKQVAENSERRVSVGVAPADQALREIANRMEATLGSFKANGIDAEGEAVAERLAAYDRAPSDDARATLRTELLRESTEIGKVLGMTSAPATWEPYTTTVAKDGKLPLAVDAASKRLWRDRKAEIDAVLGWATLKAEFARLKSGQPLENATRLADWVARKQKAYREAGHDDMVSELEGLAREIKIARQTPPARDVIVSETDDPALISQMGALHPEMVDCFNPNGNPDFNSFVLAAMTSKNIKMIVVRDAKTNEVLARAIYKVKRTAEGKPVLFLERGLTRAETDMVEPMLALLHAKAAKFDEAARPLVMKQITDKITPEDIEVFGTGTTTGEEYVEPTFSQRRAGSVRHRGRIVPPPPVSR